MAAGAAVVVGAVVVLLVLLVLLGMVVVVVLELGMAPGANRPGPGRAVAMLRRRLRGGSSGAIKGVTIVAVVVVDEGRGGGLVGAPMRVR
jgi:hypothetical protein